MQNYSDRNQDNAKTDIFEIFKNKGNFLTKQKKALN